MSLVLFAYGLFRLGQENASLALIILSVLFFVLCFYSTIRCWYATSMLTDYVVVVDADPDPVPKDPKGEEINGS